MGKPIEKKDYEKRYQSARWDIMLLIALTVINLGVMLFGDNVRYVSSAAIPLSLVVLGKIMCGKMDNEFYVGKYAGIEFLDDGFLIGMIAVAIVIIGIYVLLWFLSKNHVVPLIIAGALIVIDTISMPFIYTTFTVDLIFDYAIHVLMVIMIAMGVHAGFKLKKIKADEEAFLASVSTHRNQFANRR